MDYTTGIILPLSAIVLLLGFLVYRFSRFSQEQKTYIAKLALLATKVDQAIMLISREGLVEWVNPGYCNMCGFESASLVGRTPESVLLETMPNPKSVQQIRSGLASGRSFFVELLCAHRNGRRYWLSMHFTPLQKPSAKGVAFVGIGIDVTSRKNTESETVFVRRRNESVLELLQDAVLIVDPQGRISFVNPAAVRLTRWQAAQLIGQSLSTVVHQLRIQKISAEQKDLFILSALQQGSVLVGDTDLFKDRDGNLFPVELDTIPLRDSSKGPSAMVIFRDATPRQQLQNMQLAQTHQLELRAEVACAMGGADCVRVSLQKCAQAIVQHFQGDFARIWTVNTREDALELQAGAGVCTQIEGNQSLIKFGASEVGLVAADKAPLRIDDLAANAITGDRDWIRREELSSFVGVPIFHDKKMIGVVAIYAKNTLPQETIDQLAELASIIGIGIVQKSALEKMTEQAALLDKSQDAIVLIDLNNRVLFWNKSAERLYGYNAREVQAKPVHQFIYRDSAYFDRGMEETLKKGEWKGESCQVNKGDETVIVDCQWTLILDNAGQPKSVLMVNTDITEKKNIEAQFLRTQRMESLGTLAGGIAHDLNNVLAPILMSSEILKQKFQDDQSRRLLSIVESSAKRGAEMVKQVLTFSRGVEGERVLLQARHLIKEVLRIVGDTFPKTIQIRTHLRDNLWPIMGDATQLHQVLVNLVVNARDAMPKGGLLTLSAENKTVEPGAGGADLIPGPYLMLSVTDTGTGISAEILDKVFEPFFTTKEMGKGTGLGLATVLGIVKSHGGHVQVQTELNKGTTFRVYLPATQVPQTSGSETDQKRMPTGNGELILAIDDEASVLTMTRETLENFGYRVVTARDGTEAIAEFSAHRNEIKGVLTDMLMPYMDGPATIRVLKKLDPAVRIVAASGLMDSERVKDATGIDNIAFLMKPYTTEKLLNTIHDLLHGTN